MEIQTTHLSGYRMPLEVFLSIRQSNERVMTAEELKDARKKAARNMVRFRSDTLLYPFWRGLFNYYKKRERCEDDR